MRAQCIISYMKIKYPVRVNIVSILENIDSETKIGVATLLWYHIVFTTVIEYIKNNVCTLVMNYFSTHERFIFCLFPHLRSNEGNKHENSTQVSAGTVHQESTYIILCLTWHKGNKHENSTQVSAETVHRDSSYFILFLTWHNKSINDDKNDDIYTSSLCLTHAIFLLLMMSKSVADDITITRQLWHDHMNSDI